VTASVVVGIGQARAGDDGVGIAVARSLAARGLRDLEVRESRDAWVLVELLGEGRRVVLVDAVVGGGAPGTVLRLAADALPAGITPLSTHGMGVADALELARVLHGEEATRDTCVVGVVIGLPLVRGAGLSPRIVDAVDRAATLAADLAAGNPAAHPP
jgi:hydrogenase maturation protease